MKFGTWRVLAVLAWLMAAPCAAQSRTQGGLPVHVRLTLGAAMMVSGDQLGWLGYDALGLVGDVQVGYTLVPGIAARIGLNGGGFPAGARTGGLLGPQFGFALGWPEGNIRPWLQFDAGPGFTGSLLRLLVRGSIGVDFPLASWFSLGPTLGYSQLFQNDEARSTTDARFLWFGVTLGLQSFQSRQHPEQTRWLTRHRTIERVHITEREPPPPPPSAASEPTPSPELIELIETTLPSEKNEWLAPVLFQFDSAELEPQGVAMLHEVAGELARRPQLRLLEIHGYADSRGSAEYNLKLSERRASAVLEWLVVHGIARERLRVAAEGVHNPVEQGDAESQHEQNRRVVFRVIESEP